jgi:hypothetical protein
MSFREMIDEMAVNRGYTDSSSFNRKADWNIIKNRKHDVIRDRIGSNHYKVVKDGSTYYLVSENNEYLGSIEFRIGSKHIILASNSLIDRGFYAIMFTVILSSGVKEIISDSLLSTNAIDSYEKLAQGHTSLKVEITDGIEMYPFDRNRLLSNRHLRVSVTEKHNTKEIFEEYYNRLESSRSFINEYNTYSGGLDVFLFGSLD